MRGEKDEVEERGAVGKRLTTKDTKEHKERSENRESETSGNRQSWKSFTAEEDRKTFNHKGHEETQR
jgi:hypothetical protein